jgi:SAM-dependent methyltransferase
VNLRRKSWSKGRNTAQAKRPEHRGRDTEVEARASAELLEANRQFYNPLWADARLVGPERFNTWALVSTLIRPGQRRLEVAPGLRPRLPLAGTQFADISTPAVAKLRASGADAVVSLVWALPYADAGFDLVCALDIIEHVADDRAALAELARVAAPGAVLLLSAPLHPAYCLTTSLAISAATSRRDCANCWARTGSRSNKAPFTACARNPPA